MTCNSVVKKISTLSGTIKELVLIVDEKLSFLPGQWVDFFIPKRDMLAGYSINSSTTSLRNTGTLRLAVKYSSYAPTDWVHNECKVGDVIKIKVGGDIYLPIPSPKDTGSVLLVAGGIGINPMLSMLAEAAEHRTPRNYHLVYSAASLSELVYKSEIDDMVQCNDNISVTYHVTKEICSEAGIFNRRMSAGSINALISTFPGPVKCFMCGPPPMIDDLAPQINAEVIYEKWW